MYERLFGAAADALAAFEEHGAWDAKWIPMEVRRLGIISQICACHWPPYWV